ncbi:hypothetical protein N9S39_04755 [Candidatus Pelagibacter sp.]|nr:hypothetical protein [Candidatus Pelagibacter sp.]
MQFSKNTSIGSGRNNIFSILIKSILIITVIIGAVIMLGKIDFPSPNKEIEKVIPNEKLKVVK